MLVDDLPFVGAYKVSVTLVNHFVGILLRKLPIDTYKL